MTKPDISLPDAKEFMKKLALAKAEEASKQARKYAEAEAEKKALLGQLSKPSGVSDDERIKRTVAIIERAMSNGRTEVELGRFPNSPCTDHGRAINQQEPGWESTLTGLPKNSMTAGTNTSARAVTSCVYRSWTFRAERRVTSV